jgi:4-diphosphocytidyl-2-C-methyl-D-erythritol kinase
LSIDFFCTHGVKMDLRRDDLTRIARAPAKLNVFLGMLGRRDDGFHELETLMVPIRLFDSVAFLPISPTKSDEVAELQLSVRVCDSVGAAAKSAAIPEGRENLIIRALELLRQRSGCEFGAKIALVKRIPSEAGMGGGSSDAATALKLANSGWGLDWSIARLAEIAAEIGSDVPFFLYEGAAVCRGRGERVERLRTASPPHFVVVKPPVGLNTSEVYRALDNIEKSSNSRSADSGSGLTEAVAGYLSGRASELGRQMRNGLQRAASSLSPWVDKLKSAFDELDFAGHQLSGSGTAYFGVCRHAQHARRLANILRTRQLGLVYATRSCQ